MLSQRGIDPEAHIKAMKDFYEMADKAGIVFDGDPRRTARSGSLQAPVGYIRPREDDADSED